MILILPLIMGMIALVVVIAFGIFTFALTSAGYAMQSATKASDTRSIKALVIGGGTLGFFYAWFAIGSFQNEKGFEYIFTLSIALSICMIAASLIALSSALFLRGQSIISAKAPNMIKLSSIWTAVAGIIFGLMLMIYLEGLMNDETFARHILACASDASFQRYRSWFELQDFTWCVKHY